MVWPGWRVSNLVTMKSSERGFPEALIPAPKVSSLSYIWAPSRKVMLFSIARRTRSVASC